MNADVFALIGAGYPSNHPFKVANISTSIGLTETAFSFANGGVAALAVPLQTDIIGSQTPVDPGVNAALLMDDRGSVGGWRMPHRPYFNSGSFDGKSIRVRAQGTASFTAAGGGATTIAVNIYAGTSATLGSDTKICGPTALSVAASKVALVNFVVEAALIWDSASTCIFGEYWASISGNVDVGGANTKTSSYTSRAALTNTATASAPSGLSFIPSVAFGTTAPAGGGSVVLNEFSIERV